MLTNNTLYQRVNLWRYRFMLWRELTSAASNDYTGLSGRAWQAYRCGLYYEAVAAYIAADKCQAKPALVKGSQRLAFAESLLMIGHSKATAGFQALLDEGVYEREAVIGLLAARRYDDTILPTFVGRVKTSTRAVVLCKLDYWKREFISDFFSDADVYIAPHGREHSVIEALKSVYEKLDVAVWGYRDSDDNGDVDPSVSMRIEDGFIRSIGLGAEHTRPLSLCVDGRHLYFDATGASKLEQLLINYDFSADKALLDEASTAIASLLANRVSKYNFVGSDSHTSLVNCGGRKVVVVIGQVEDDESIKRGCSRIITNNDLVRMAASENPLARVLYRPHPDVVAKKRAELSDPAEVSDICEIIGGQVSLTQTLDVADHVYTITSLVGFEALLRGVKVTTVGAPFYSGWGLTDDRQNVSRRQRQLTVVELFAAAYLLYPEYRGPQGEHWTCMQAITYLTEQKTRNKQT
jgi:capsular polysaccharide export protein